MQELRRLVSRTDRQEQIDRLVENERNGTIQMASDSECGVSRHSNDDSVRGVLPVGGKARVGAYRL